jgi:hypothetical protein
MVPTPTPAGLVERVTGVTDSIEPQTLETGAAATRAGAGQGAALPAGCH